MRRTLDANSYTLRRHPTNMIARFATLDREQLWLSAIVAAQLRFGAAKLAAPRFQAAVEYWLVGFDVWPWPLEATHHYAKIRTALGRAGQPIGGMELMIAAHALAEDGVAITNNVRKSIVCLVWQWRSGLWWSPQGNRLETGLCREVFSK